MEHGGFPLIPVSGALALALALVHLFAGKLRFLDVIPRSRWLSAAGGISVGYVFGHLLPDMASRQRHLERVEALDWIHALEFHIFLIALAGLVIFYGLETAARKSRARSSGESSQKNAAGPKVFWLHMASFGLYNGLIGYLLLNREQPGWSSMIFYTLAMSAHFLVNDYGLRQYHKALYHKLGQWLLSGAVVLGWMAGTQWQVSRAVVAIFYAFLSGGIILNVIKEELPKERESRFWAFALGAAGYTALLLAT
ncbi:MAG: hypothetical protein C4524_09285 [Candidatus Zixiibacteriota bacterium]|nr:MAG: hypothetical protein C4524_09285 [candidate division Zixibacteria bacterium]